MVCRLFGAKPLSKPLSMKISSAKWQPFCPGGDELRVIGRGKKSLDTLFIHLFLPPSNFAVGRHGRKPVTDTKPWKTAVK